MITLKQLEESGQIIPISFTDPTIIKVCSQSQKWIRKKGFECVAPVSYRNRQKQLKVSELVTIGEFNIYLNENCAGCASPRHS